MPMAATMLLVLSQTWFVAHVRIHMEPKVSSAHNDSWPCEMIVLNLVHTGIRPVQTYMSHNPSPGNGG